MQTQYQPTSPYALTSQTSIWLDIWTPRPIPAQSSDQLLTILPTWQYKPDLLAYDLYGSVQLWWIFSVRNPDTIIDPIWDMEIGTQIFVPTADSLKSVLNV